MVPVPDSVPFSVCPVGHPLGGPLRHQMEQEAVPVRLSDSGQIGMAGGCHVHELAESLRLRLPSDSNPSPGHSQSGLDQLQDSVGGPSVAGQTLVSGPPGPTYRLPQVPTSEVGPAETAEVEPVPQEPGQSQPSRLATVQRSLTEKGFSEQVASCIARPNRKSTLAVYQSKWSIFSSGRFSRCHGPRFLETKIMAGAAPTSTTLFSRV